MKCLTPTKLKSLIDLIKIIELAQWEIKEGNIEDAKDTLRYLIKDLKVLTDTF